VRCFARFFVFLEQAGAILTGPMQKLAERIFGGVSVPRYGNRVVTLHALVYFVALAGLALYLNIVILGKRRWAHGEGAAPLGLHYAVRALACL